MKARIVKDGHKYAAQEFVGIGWATIGMIKDGKACTRLFDSKKEARQWLEANDYQIREEV